MGRLLIDYSKNTAPLQDDGGGALVDVSIRLRYHDPSGNLDRSSMSNSSGRRKILPPNPSYPLMHLDQLEKQINPSGRVRQLSPNPRGRSPKRSYSRVVTFQIPSISIFRQRRFETQRLHSSEGDLDFTEKSNHSTPDRRTSILSKDDTFAYNGPTSVVTAPAAPPSYLRRSDGKKLEDDDQESDDEKRGSGSFLPTALMNTKPADKPPTKKKKKKKQSVSLDAWFHKEGGGSVNTEEEEPSKTLTRSNEALKRQSELAFLQRQMSMDDDCSWASQSQSSLLSTSQRSLAHPLGQSHDPLGPRRRPPKRTKSFDDSLRGRATTTTGSRRGKRRPGDGDGGPPPSRKPPARSLSSSDGSFRSLKSSENSHSFIAGSRIRIRRTAGLLLGGGGGDPEEGEDEESLLPTNPGRPRERRLPGRIRSCEDLPPLRKK